ncbi:uncharacterized protein EI90DRAFT_3292448 [Cantharellus anzutake]|uniref:uncharacterized protein n=1 Tax=Cantharellus anzutake TaxID=1750568 RepID=UPI001905AEF5|nr:uncharacterized protein EI90DRAFT_3292448 [Cantharellus anzutake]KAF8322924.1 hypothetical protein EI90DRAFT_3292448 [Cantharellus anzutake]
MLAWLAINVPKHIPGNAHSSRTAWTVFKRMCEDNHFKKRFDKFNPRVDRLANLDRNGKGKAPEITAEAIILNRKRANSVQPNSLPHPQSLKRRKPNGNGAGSSPKGNAPLSLYGREVSDEGGGGGGDDSDYRSPSPEEEEEEPRKRAPSVICLDSDSEMLNITFELQDEDDWTAARRSHPQLRPLVMLDSDSADEEGDVDDALGHGNELSEDGF